MKASIDAGSPIVVITIKWVGGRAALWANGSYRLSLFGFLAPHVSRASVTSVSV